MTEVNIGKWMHENDASDVFDGRMFKSPEALEGAVSTLDSQLDSIWEKREIDERTRLIAKMSAASINATHNTIFTQKEGERV